MTVEQEIQRFKMELLRKMPFYGDILMQVPFVEDKQIPTAATNGKTIWYNEKFLSGLSTGEKNFVLLHEVFHILLRHGVRNADAKRDKDIWNIACDIIVNDMLVKLQRKMNDFNIPFQMPSTATYIYIELDETAENLYEKIKADNANKNQNSKKLKVRMQYSAKIFREPQTKELEIPSDIRTFDLSQEEINRNDQILQGMIRASIQKNRDTMGSYYVPSEIYRLVDSRKLDWRRMLKDFLSQEIGDDSSYTTPERKYLHMDRILPGHSLTEETLEEIWAFVDSSGSINHNEMDQFLTQLYRISREFKCIVNICYWDTSVTNVYKKIRRTEDILTCIPHSFGGTDINCVYDWIHKNKVKPDVMLILTDGYFGPLTTPSFNHQLRKKTILVLNSNIAINDDMKKIGKIAKL